MSAKAITVKEWKDTTMRDGRKGTCLTAVAHQTLPLNSPLVKQNKKSSYAALTLKDKASDQKEIIRVRTTI